MARQTSSSQNNTTTPTTRRRKGSSLGADARGDTGAGSIATNLSRPKPEESPRNSSDRKAPRERKRKKALKLARRWKRTCLKHTWLLPLLLLLVLLSAYFISPGEHNPLHSAIYLSYPNPPLAQRTTTIIPLVGNVTQYGKGPKDFAFVAFYALVLTFTREFIMQRLIKPIGVYAGIRRGGKMSRFMEQFYTAIYFAIFGPFGLWVMSRTPVWYFNTAGMYEGFPHRAHDLYFKAYYLLQASYWAQQFLVLCLQLEKPRKDFKELVLHHIVTLALIGLSYRFHFTYMGVAVYITHDISDFFLATSKILNYLDPESSIMPAYFTLFFSVWTYTRHYINLVILASLLPATTLRNPLYPYLSASPTISTGQFSTVGDYRLNWDTQQYKCWISQAITFGLIAVLQAVNLFWFWLLLKIGYRALFKGVQKDVRSDDEDEEEETPEEAVGNGSAVAVEVEKPMLTLNGKPVS